MMKFQNVTSQKTMYYTYSVQNTYKMLTLQSAMSLVSHRVLDRNYILILFVSVQEYSSVKSVFLNVKVISTPRV